MSRIRGGVLRQVADQALRFDRRLEDIVAADGDLAAVGGMKPVIMRIVVDLPAPFGPRKPSTSPRSTVNEMPSTARLGPKLSPGCRS